MTGDEEIVHLDVVPSPLFGGPLPFGTYHHESIGSLRVQTRPSSKSDGLFADDIWPGSLLMADILADKSSWIENKSVLELGAGAALPSLVCAKVGAKRLVISDYPDTTILSSIEDCLHVNKIPFGDCKSEDANSINVVGHMWGESVSPLLEPLRNSASCKRNETQLFDLLILSELLWKDTYDLHRALLQSVCSCLSKNGIALVSFAHRPSPDGTHTPEKDMQFFDLAVQEFAMNFSLLCSCIKKDCFSGSYNTSNTDTEEDGNVTVHLYQLTFK